MSSPRRGHPSVPSFFGPHARHPFTEEQIPSNHAPHQGKAAHVVSRTRGPRKAPLVDGIVKGERVLLASEVSESEKGLEVRVRVALAAAGVLVMKHMVAPCWECGAKPNARQGLGVGCSDLICVVPPRGIMVGIEMKRPHGGVVSDEQKLWLAVVRRFGGVTGVARSVEEAMELIEEARSR